jgi:hypothetical protein
VCAGTGETAVPQYLLTIKRRPHHIKESPTAHVEPHSGTEPFKRGPLGGSIGVGADILTARYGCEGMAEVRRCLANEGKRLDFTPWAVGLLENVTFAEDIDLA